jgi:hypothetical protein
MIGHKEHIMIRIQHSVEMAVETQLPACSADNFNIYDVEQKIIKQAKKQ